MSRESKSRRLPVILPETESATSGWLRNIRFSGFSLLMLVILVLFVVILAPSLRTLVQQQQQIAAIQDEVERQKADVTDLQGDVARWSDPAYIEAQARDRLLYVYPGEYSYLVMGDATTDAERPQAPISDELQTPQVDWIAAMTSSVIDAGLSDEPATELIAPDIDGSELPTSTPTGGTP
ncbi:septum formation initiator family protein [Frigoribacterium sp. CFBP9039]|uniref:FtsB family cell division protein n=1 Tax=Frigoribacterium TaxID=96492 RepID=UPI0017870A66|nr:MULTISPECIES: septum formation initiator family protein [Frigoribacterium]MBD8702982.1 septum formation initiator family protein [Frigoribacterium sp. CFBP 13712]MCJ0700032.1 septum formation initiator family protein [Frigoribacterium faeni]MDY0890417.1 septum formation initiator family protein [Frigoribacterium sp. CFBP9030]MDY0944766.1 septum formation initiator family protein [Frigoribacterium sp. CFBP9039]